MDNALRRVPAWAWLVAIVVGSAVFRAILGRGIVAPFIMVDEIIWSEVARGLADAGEPLLRDQPDPGYSIVYPLLISPVYVLFESLPDAYAALKVLNAVLMSLAAVPVYFLARRVMRDSLALFAALLAVALPSLAYTGTVMTENVFYPLFLVVALVLVLVLERPTTTRVVLLFALLGLAFATRVQAVALLPAILVAPFVLSIFERRGLGSTISRFRSVYGVTAGLVVAGLAIQLVGGRSPQELLGAYSPVDEASYDLGEVLQYLWWHVAELSLYVLVIPLAATIVLLGRVRSLDQRLQAFLAATVSLTVCLVPVVAAFASRFSDRIEERNLFYVAPLFTIGLLAWVERGAPRPRVLATGRSRRLRTARRRDPVRSVPDHLRDHGHVDAAAAVVAPGPDRRGLDRSRRNRSRCGPGCRVPLRPAALRTCAPSSRARPLDTRHSSHLVGNPWLRAVLTWSALPGDTDGRARLGRPRVAL